MKRIAAAVLAACATPGAAQDLDLSRYQMVDLTHAFNQQTPYWPTSPTAFRLDTLSRGETPGGYFYSANA